VAQAAPVVGIDDVSEREVAVAGGNIRVRLYRHGARGDTRRVVVYYHGGGWVLGDLEHSDALCRWLAHKSGYLVVNVDYRLAPENRYPIAAEDAYSAFRWVAAHASDLDVDPGCVAISGGSAGGNLAAVVALMARDRGGQRPAALVLAYPVLDAACDAPSFREYAEGYIVETADMLWYWQQYLARPEQAIEPYAAPMRAADLAGLPPTLIITAECDPVRDDGERFAERLKEAGVAVTLSRYNGALHGFFAQPGQLTAGTAAVTEAIGFLQSVMGNGA
jgi:acetyl esterase